MMIIYSIGNYLIEPFFALMPYFIFKNVSEQPLVLGMMNTFLAVGMLSGSGLYGLISLRYRKLKIVAFCEILIGLMIVSAVLLFNTSVWFVAYVPVLLLGIIMSIEQVNVDILYQETCEEFMLSRVMSIRCFMSTGLRPASKLLNGYLSSVIGIITTILVNSIGMISFGSLWMVLLGRKIKRPQ